MLINYMCYVMKLCTTKLTFSEVQELTYYLYFNLFFSTIL